MKNLTELYKIVEVEDSKYRVMNIETGTLENNTFNNTYDAVKEAIKLWSKKLALESLGVDLVKDKMKTLSWDELENELESSLESFFK